MSAVERLNHDLWGRGPRFAAEELAEEIDALGASIMLIGSGVVKVDRSGVITLGGQAQSLMLANPARRGWSFQNKSTSNMWFNDLGGAANPLDNDATYLQPGAYYESEFGGASVQAISLIGDVTGSQFVAKEW